MRGDTSIKRIRDARHDALVAIDSYDLTPDDVRTRLAALFGAGKTEDEFEFSCTLLRVRGMESPGWDPFDETYQLVGNLTALISAPLLPHTKVRLGLLLYSHMTEVGTMYDMLANLTRVVAGERYVIDPFLEHRPVDRNGHVRFLSTPAKVRALETMLEDVEHRGIAEAIRWFFHSSIRNAFAHADYTLAGDRFRSRSELFEHGGIRSQELHLDVVAEVVNRSLAFYDEFVSEYVEQRTSYRQNKIVLGRFSGGPEPAPIELLADEEHGLYGFQSPPDTSGSPQG